MLCSTVARSSSCRCQCSARIISSPAPADPLHFDEAHVVRLRARSNLVDLRDNRLNFDSAVAALSVDTNHPPEMKTLVHASDVLEDIGEENESFKQHSPYQ